MGETNKLKTMKVKIVKGNYWYSSRVGETYEVEEATNYDVKKYRVIDNESTRRYLIDAEDCELIQDPVKIPFTFSQWDKDRTQKVWTRDGREVLQLTHFEKSGEFAGDTDKGVRTWYNNGTWSCGENELDLFLEHHEREYWVNVYEGEAGIFLGSICKSEKEVNCTSCPGYKLIKTISFKA